MKGQGAHQNSSFEDHEFSQQMSWKCHEILFNGPVYQCPVSLPNVGQKEMHFRRISTVSGFTD